jgi:hypothetical protein
MLYKARKLWLGHVSVRDNIVQECIRRKEDLMVDLMGQLKTYPYRSLKTYLTNTYNTEFESKYNKGQKYKLIDFPW